MSVEKQEIQILYLNLFFVIVDIFLSFWVILEVDWFYSSLWSIIITILGTYLLANNNRNISLHLDNFFESISRFTIFIPAGLLSLLFTISYLIVSDEIKVVLNSKINLGVNFIKETGISISIFKNILQFVISIIIIYSFVIILIYGKAILHSVKEFLNQDNVLKAVARDFLDDVLNASSKISYNLGVKKIIKGLSGQGVSIKTYHFVRLLGVSASLRPDIVYGCWNTTWYHPKDVFDFKSGVKSDGTVFINEEWKTYFDNLENVYKHNKNRKHIRIFIVKNPKEVISYLNNPDSLEFLYWFFLFNQHKKWGVKHFYLVSSSELESQITDGFNTEIPIWRDFAIFEKNLYYRKKYWAFAQENKPIKDISTVFYETGKVTKDVFNFFFDDNDRWQSRIQLQIDDNNNLKIIK